MDTRNVSTGRGVRKVNCLSPNLFHFYNESLNKEALEGFFNNGATAPVGQDLLVIEDS